MMSDKKTYTDTELDSALVTTKAEHIAFLKESTKRLTLKLKQQSSLLGLLEKME